MYVEDLGGFKSNSCGRSFDFASNKLKHAVNMWPIGFSLMMNHQLKDDAAIIYKTFIWQAIELNF